MSLELPSVYYESFNFTITYDEERALGKAVWRGKLSKADLQEAFLICAHVMEKYRLTRWLADDRQMKSFPEEDRDWISEHVVPAFLASPLRRMAILPSEDLDQVEAVEHLIQLAGDLGDLTLRNFQDEEEALRWLMQAF
ncbi:SpoIIAA family protein [Rufibacter psychrotolerans]|uniref:STAS/SEC14 domain-containing protein n=1 Tax=Rufibacter psychrotolerans TaxID=2812556 RepID=UPI001967F16A|nr:STAS/SEC14 domain-containing protein [Rufibacter sp. SYSU D00308]